MLRFREGGMPSHPTLPLTDTPLHRSRLPTEPEEHAEAGEGDRPSHGEGVQGHGAGVGRYRRQVGPLLRPRAGQLPASDADRVQDALAAVEQNLLLVSCDALV